MCGIIPPPGGFGMQVAGYYILFDGGEKPLLLRLPESYNAFSAGFERPDFAVRYDAAPHLPDKLLCLLDDSPHPFACYTSGEGYVFFFGGGQLIVYAKPDFSECSVMKNETEPDEFSRFICQLFFAFCSLRGTSAFHAAALEYDGVGFCVCAESGGGKTTHARLLRTAGALIINGDKTLCRKTGGFFTLYGSPWCGASGEYINRACRLQKLFFLEKSPDNSVLPLFQPDACVALCQRLYTCPFIPTVRVASQENAARLCGSVPAYRLLASADPSAARQTLNALEGNKIEVSALAEEIYNGKNRLK